MKVSISQALLALAATGSVLAAPWANDGTFGLIERQTASIPSMETVPAEKISAPSVVAEGKQVATTDSQAQSKGYGTLCVSSSCWFGNASRVQLPCLLLC
jgi:hypothetical protein